MREKRISWEFGPSLPELLDMIVDRLLADDWCGFADEQGDRYLVVGYEASSKAGGNFNSAQFPHFKRVSKVAECFVRSQLAGQHPGHLRQIRRLLEETGVPPEVIDRLQAGELDFKGFRWNESVPLQERSEKLLEFLKLSVNPLSQERLEQLKESDEEEINDGREKLFLKEVAQKYEAMVDRGVGLDPVAFHDPQLEEASRCYLYSFYRASIVLGAAAVEMHLKRETGVKRFDRYDQLVKKAVWLGKLTPQGADCAGKVFQVRRGVVHDGDKPTHDVAQEVLFLAKEVVSQLTRNDPSG